MNEDLKDYIGVFDSGAGGLSVLKEMKKLLPNENFYYFGDSKHAPYGVKSIKEVQDRTFESVNYMVNHGVKSVVIACNTATSIAIQLLRDVFEIPIIGVEPAIKPAIENNVHQKILVMATENTLKLDKFNELINQLNKDATIIPCVCTGLPDLVEKGHLNDDVLNKYLHETLDQYKDKVDCVVLGCTHFPLIKQQILDVLGDIPCFDGGEGTARQLKHVLEESHILSENREGKIIYASSDENAIELYKEIM